jgi:hypothetical protein
MTVKTPDPPMIASAPTPAVAVTWGRVWGLELRL